jgi:CheY-like chemotaxis protein
MISVLIISYDKDVANLLSLIIEGAGYTAVCIQTVAELSQISEIFDFIILDRPFNLSSDDWGVLKKLKEAGERNLPIAITNTPQMPWLRQNSRDIGMDMFFPYPCDLTVEIPKLLETYFGSK